MTGQVSRSCTHSGREIDPLSPSSLSSSHAASQTALFLSAQLLMHMQHHSSVAFQTPFLLYTLQMFSAKIQKNKIRLDGSIYRSPFDPLTSEHTGHTVKLILISTLKI